MSFGKPKAPKPTAEQKALEKQQVEQLAQLNAQENERRKRLLAAQQGVRAFAGSALTRGAPSNTAGGPAVPASGGGGGNYGGGNYGGYGGFALNTSLIRSALVR